MKEVKEVRFVVPPWIHALVQSEAEQYGMTIADLMRSILADRYRDRLFSADAAATSPAARAAVSVEEVES